MMKASKTQPSGAVGPSLTTGRRWRPKDATQQAKAALEHADIVGLKSSNISQFQPITLLNMQGKIFFSVIAQRWTSFPVKDELVDVWFMYEFEWFTQLGLFFHTCAKMLVFDVFFGNMCVINSSLNQVSKKWALRYWTWPNNFRLLLVFIVKVYSECRSVVEWKGRTLTLQVRSREICCRWKTLYVIHIYNKIH